MPEIYSDTARPRRRLMTLDGWAVVLALALAAAVRLGLLPAVRW